MLVKPKGKRSFLAFSCLCAFLLLSIVNFVYSPSSFVYNTPSHLPCWSLPGANDTVVILRTGSTELQQKLPVHLSTTLRCYPNYLIFSDYEEEYHGEHILDALESLHPDILATNPDFELYRRLKQDSRASLAESDLSHGQGDFRSITGNAENPGWKLDKWKFLPMMNRTLVEYPDMKWYIFVEADTFILWKQLLQWLASKDHTHPHYTGSQMFANGALFAHGGSGFAVSQPAMRMVVEHYTAHKAELEAIVDAHWAGDVVLGKAFQDAGVSFTNAWPMIQGDFPGLLAYARPDGRPVADENVRQWCYPAVSYHHMTPSMMQDIWSFEQQWISRHDAVSHPERPELPSATDLRTKNPTILRHKDIFEHYIMPRMMFPRDDWDNLSESNEEAVGSFEECRARCEAQPECRQYSIDAEGRCRNRVDPRLGMAADGVRSGWVEDRIKAFPESMAPCEYHG